MADEEELVIQPDEAVTAEPEITEPDVDESPSAEEVPTEEPELILDAEGYQPTKPNLNPDLPEYKAFKKEKAAKLRKQQQIDDLVARERIHHQKMSDVEAKLAKIERGPKPTFESCNYDDAAYHTAMESWHDPNSAYSVSQPPDPSGNTQTHTQPSPAAVPPEILLDDRTEYAHFQNETALRKSFRDYDQTVEGFKDELHQAFELKTGAVVPRDSVVNAVINVGHTAGVDMSKAMLATAKIPSLKNELFDPRVLSSDILIADVLRKAERAIKSSKAVSSKPPAEVRQGGAIDNVSASERKAFAQWTKTGSMQDHAAYKAAKKAALKNGNAK